MVNHSVSSLLLKKKLRLMKRVANRVSKNSVPKKNQIERRRITWFASTKPREGSKPFPSPIDWYWISKNANGCTKNAKAGSSRRRSIATSDLNKPRPTDPSFTYSLDLTDNNPVCFYLHRMHVKHSNIVKNWIYAGCLDFEAGNLTVGLSRPDCWEKRGQPHIWCELLCDDWDYES